MAVRDDKYQSKQGFRARGLQDLERLVGGVDEPIRAALGRRGRARVLELGCGYGTALLEIGQRFGDAVELHGWNLRREDGDEETLRRNARERGLGGDPAGSRLPALHFGDIAAGLHFPDDTFDLVYSQVAWLYFGRKIAVLREVMRVLAPEGVARIDLDEERPNLPPEYRRLIEIWRSGRLVPFGEYARTFGATLTPATEGEYLQFGKRTGPLPREDLELVLQIELERICPDWDGVKCVYRQREGN